eukprot:298756_1
MTVPLHVSRKIVARTHNFLLYIFALEHVTMLHVYGKHIQFDEYSKRQIDVIEEKELEKDEQYICRRIRDSRTSCLRCETLSKQCNNHKQRLDKVANELELLK